MFTLQAVHAKMPISKVEFDLFNDIFIAALAKLGVDAGDQATIRSVLNSFESAIVNPSYICPKYAKALGVSQTTLMTTVVTAVVTKEVGDPTIVGFFNGTSPPGSTNFLTSKPDFDRLAGGLVAFFGAALGCDDPAFPKYTGVTDMKVPIHIFVT